MAKFITKIRTESGDLPVDYNALGNLPILASDNLLINGDFRNVVNQRRATSYSDNTSDDNWTYSVDRWRIKNANVTVNDKSIKVTATGSSGGTIQQAIGYYLPTDDYTASCSVKDIVGTAKFGVTGHVHNSTLVVGKNIATWNDVEVGSLSITLEANSSIELEWIKLETGTIATPFVPRPYCEEIAMCQRYYKYVERTPIFASNDTSLTYFMPVQFGIPMRENPTKILRSVLSGNGTEQTDVTLDQCVSSIYNVTNIKLSKSIGQYGYVTIAFDAEYY